MSLTPPILHQSSFVSLGRKVREAWFAQAAKRVGSIGGGRAIPEVQQAQLRFPRVHTCCRQRILHNFFSALFLCNIGGDIVQSHLGWANVCCSSVSRDHRGLNLRGTYSLQGTLKPHVCGYIYSLPFSLAESVQSAVVSCHEATNPALVGKGVKHTSCRTTHFQNPITITTPCICRFF